MVRELLVPMLQAAFAAARAKGVLSAPELPPVIIENPPNEDFGDYSTNLAMLLAKGERKAPLVIAERLREHLPVGGEVLQEVKVEKPGFLNFYLKTDYLASRLAEVLGDPGGFGRSRMGEGQSVHLEFVSANPTGPLHVGHGRGAAVGDCLARVLEASGFKVHREYYINDAGQQWLTAGKSALLRYYEALDIPVDFPADHYPGEYIKDIAKSNTYERYLFADIAASAQFQEAIAPGGLLPTTFDEELVRKSATITCGVILGQIKRDLEQFRVRFDAWYSEAELYKGEKGGLVQQMIELLEKSSKIYQRDGAKWLKSTDFLDEKDRVVVREDGRPTYLASDIAYHDLKFQKNFDRYINIWGADHHGYLARVKASLEMLGHDPAKLQVLFIQFVNLKRGDQPVSMGKRTGEFVELSEVVNEVGVDAARFFFLLRSADTTLDFDLELAKQQSSENPVYYVQYAHARVASLFRQAAEQGVAAEALGAAPPG
ncbi:MAG: arginine--tRNA ligase, partial [Nitrospinota bacterium]